MLKITRAKSAAKGAKVVFAVSGHLDSENITELMRLISAEPTGQYINLDLSELTIVDADAVRFLKSCESKSIVLKNCPAYVREWITIERGGS